MANQPQPPAPQPRNDGASAPNNQTPEFSPGFWDSLREVFMTRRSLRELDRRNDLQIDLGKPRIASITDDIQRFARHGGPNKSHLRGYGFRESEHTPLPSAILRLFRKSGVLAATAFNRNFETYLDQHDILPPPAEDSESAEANVPANFDHLIDQLKEPRRSFSHSRLRDSEFDLFRQKDKDAVSRDAVMNNLILRLLGDTGEDIASACDLPLVNLEPITGEHTLDPRPGLYDGAEYKELSEDLRRDLNRLILPTKDVRDPVAPNFFLETTGPKDPYPPVERQARFHGANGARAMHHLQNYALANPQYDGNAYTFSAVHHDGHLGLYAHHVTKPAADGSLQYHMTELASGSVRLKRSFIHAVTMLKNMRQIAKQFRDEFIDHANARTKGKGKAVSRNSDEDDDSSSSGDFGGDGGGPAASQSVNKPAALPSHVPLPSYIPIDDSEDEDEDGDGGKDNGTSQNAGPSSAYVSARHDPSRRGVPGHPSNASGQPRRKRQRVGDEDKSPNKRHRATQGSQQPKD